jgi:hypothetical protein
VSPVHWTVARVRGRERELGQAGLRLRAKSEAAARQGKKTVFHFYFPEIFQINSIHSSKIPF